METIEFVGLFPLALLVILIVWQFALVGYTAIVAAGAAREGARAAAVGGDYRQAVERAAPAWRNVLGSDDVWSNRDQASVGQAVTVRVRLQVMKAPFPFSDAVVLPKFETSAVMRKER